MATRPILIADAEGHIVYEKQTTDNPKAADAHIRNAGYRRVGEWANGAATVELIPASAKLKKNAIVVGVLALVIAGISAFVARSYALAPDAANNSQSLEATGYCCNHAGRNLCTDAGPDGTVYLAFGRVVREIGWSRD